MPEPDLAPVGFYGKLAHGLTRDTFICGEGSCLRPLDEFGRHMYLPPTARAMPASSSNSATCWSRTGTWNPTTAGPTRCASSSPHQGGGCATAPSSAWIAPRPRSGSYRCACDRSWKRVATAEVQVPDHPPARTLLRLRLPHEWRVSNATTGGRPLPSAGPEAFDLSSLRGRVEVVAAVTRAEARK